MSQELFEALTSLRADLPKQAGMIQQKLHEAVVLGRKNPRLKMFPRFLNILEILASLEDGFPQNNKESFTIIEKGIDTLCQMIEGKINGQEGAHILSILAQSARDLMPSLMRRGFLCSSIFWEQAAFDLRTDSIELRQCLLENNPKRAIYLVHLIKDTFAFAGMVASSKVTEEAEKRIQSGRFPEDAVQLDGIIDFFMQEALFLETFKDDEAHIINHEEHTEGQMPRLMNAFQQPNKQNRSTGGVTLTPEEVRALLEDTNDPTSFTFDNSNETDVVPLKHEHLSRGSDKSYELIDQRGESFGSVKPEYQIDPEQEDILIKLAGKLFLKQELLKNLVPEDQKILAGENWDSLDALTVRLKEKLFRSYYTPLSDLLGKDIRALVQQSVDEKGKKIKLGIRGESREVLSREGAFVKEMVFALVENALTHSIEMPVRRRALDKGETAWLLIEFEDTGGEFEIQVRDDGRGLNTESTRILENIRTKVEERGGNLTINSAENEYLKVSLRFPMKKLLTKSLLCNCGDTRFLIPLRIIRMIVSADSIENPALSKDPRCIGQISLAALMDLDKCPNNIALVCAFGEELIVLTVESVLGEIEALIEDTETPLPPCTDGAVILKGSHIGFLVNERLLYTKSIAMLEKRAETLQAIR
ncbi:MAG: hypothetical protein ACRC9L_09020 [Brevinema sp.]